MECEESECNTQILVKIFDLNKAVVEEEANSGRGGDGCFFEPLGSDGAYKTFELRTFLGVVING